jgi:uncharacterized protein
MIELALSKIKIDETRNEQVIIFREKDGERYLPVVIGMAEINAIKLKLSGVKPPRPLTHDLFVQVFDKLEARLEKVVIDRLENNTFYAKLYLTRNSHEQAIIDARPSDSVAIAIRTGAPIYVHEDVIGQAGVTEI